MIIPQLYYRPSKYTLLTPPFGTNFRDMTLKQGKETFQWFISEIPKRMDYFISLCAKDLNISREKLDYTVESLLLIWRWFLQNAKLEKTPKAELEKMREGAKFFGGSFINLTRFTVETECMLWDIGMYVGQCFVRHYKALTWDCQVTPKTSVTVNQPIIVGFVVTYSGQTGPAFFAPIHMAGVQASNIFDNTQKDSDLQNVFLQWKTYIPVAEDEG